MNKQLLARVACILLIGAVVPLGVVRAQQQRQEENAVKTTVYKMWSALGTMDTKKFKESVMFPIMAMEVTPQSAGHIFIYRNEGEFDAGDARTRQAIKSGKEKREDVQFNGSVSDLSVTMVNPNVASVIYKCSVKVKGIKQQPVALISVLRKKDNVWKVVFTTVPQ